MRTSRLKRVIPLTRAEKRGEIPKTVNDVKKVLPVWARDVCCPACSTIMIPLRAKADTQHGESITYQCYGCKAVMTLTTSVKNFMQPGDFSLSEFDWKEVAPKTVEFTDDLLDKNHFAGVAEIPPSPWKKNVLSKQVWDAFWNLYSKSDSGSVSIEELTSIVDQSNDLKLNIKFAELIKTIPVWITGRTGYAIVKKHMFFQVAGKTVGNLDELPYSDPEYRKRHGFDT